jgi:hypothetical protein
VVGDVVGKGGGARLCANVALAAIKRPVATLPIIRRFITMLHFRRGCLSSLASGASEHAAA